MGDGRMSSLNIDIKHQDKNCVTVASVPMRISAPVTVVPNIRQLPATISCCGEPTLTPIVSPCKGDICSFVVTQYLCIEIPIEIGAISKIGKPRSQCFEQSNEDVLDGGTESHWYTPKIRL